MRADKTFCDTATSLSQLAHGASSTPRRRPPRVAAFIADYPGWRNRPGGGDQLAAADCIERILLCDQAIGCGGPVRVREQRPNGGIQSWIDPGTVTEHNDLHWLPTSGIS